MERAIEFILHKFPFVSRRLDVHMLEVVNGAAVAFMLRVLGVGLGFCFNLLLARTLGAEGSGLYFLSLGVASIATVFGRMGLGNALLRFTAANAAVDNWEAVKGMYQKGIRLALVASAAAAIVMFAAAPLLADMVFHKPEIAVSVRWMAIAVVPMSLLSLHAEMLKGLKRIRDSMFVFGIGVPALSLVGLYLLGGTWGLNGAIWAYASATILMAFIGGWLWRSAVPQLRNIAGHFEWSELLRSSMPLFWVASLNMIIAWIGTFSLAIWGTKEDIGIYNIAFRTAMLVTLVSFSINSIAVPKFAALYKKKEMALIGSIAKNTAKLMILMASPLLVLFFVAPEWIMRIFGKGFESGAIILSILAVGQLVNVATGSVGALLIVSGNERLARNNSVFIVVLSILLNVVLVPLAGAIGAAIAAVTCLVAKRLIALYLVRTRLGIQPIPWIKIVNLRRDV